jgi:organic radical activating enzyme
MIIERKEKWGRLSYDTDTHTFDYEETAPRTVGPYVGRPVVLNVALTQQCNMECKHCVAKDFAGECDDDLDVTDRLIDNINASPFMVVVITGGEPLLPSCRSALGALIEGFRDKAIVVDTNGTIEPTRDLLRLFKQRQVLLRVSLDSMQAKDEVYLRHTRRGREDPESRALYFDKLERIRRLSNGSVPMGVQTVIYHRRTGTSRKNPVLGIIEFLLDVGIDRWYLQRLIPSFKFRHPPESCDLRPEEYEQMAGDMCTAASKVDIRTFAKRDRRHNSVFLLVGKGVLYTQGPRPGEKIRLGAFSPRTSYRTCFDYVSAPDHAARYYSEKED